MSGPTWATVATGVWPNLHGVYFNVLNGHRLAAFPDFLTRLRRPGRRTYLAASWGPIATAERGGPIFAAAGVPIQPEDGFSGVPFGARTVAAAA